MTRRIFRAICLAAVMVFLVTMLLILGVLYEYFSSVQKEQLKIETLLACRGVEQSGSAYLEGLKAGEYRITWIAPDGSVLYDSSSDSGSMENHLEREEIREAMTSGMGESVRYSSTLMERSLYCAQKLSDGSVVRLSISYAAVLLLVVGMLQPILIILVVVIILAFVMASRLSKRIVEPLNRLDLDDPMENKEYDELAPMLRRLSTQQLQLKKQESILLQKQNELSTIVGSMQEGMVLLDKRGRVISINHSALKLLGVKRAGTGDDLFTISRNQELHGVVEKALQGEHASAYAELQGRVIELSAAPVGSEGEVSGAAIVFFDITQREKLEQQRREFTANVSHELKTPLHSISGYSELLKCGLAAPEDVQPFAEKIHGEAQRLIRLVEDIINLSHLDEGGKDLHFTKVDLLKEARSSAESLQNLADNSGVTMSVEGDSTLVQGSEELIRGIIYNLLDNAIKYNRPGGSVEVCIDGRSLTVKDTGIGIPKEHLDRIFERFYRVDKSHSKELGGTGLGLSIVKHAAMIHKAKVSVDSAAGEGTTVTVVFPEEE